ncbi:MAG: hypothetical protein ABG776_17225 [Cyanobacteria bacterium J06555_13]
MSEVNYPTMTDKALRQYFLEHRDDKAALQTYLDRLNKRPREVITTVGAPDFDTKIQAAIVAKMQASDS